MKTLAKWASAPCVSRGAFPVSLCITLMLALCAVTLFLLAASVGHAAGIAYGTINNFDTVNDTGSPCYGFEIELDDIHCTDITYTFDWNHYGTPKITEDNSDPLHPKVFVRYAAVWTNTAWSACTIVPTGPIAPTDGHQFTNPSTNFGGEHFGVGFRTQPTTVKYNWLLDDGFHNLALGPPVSVSTPTFTYNPPVPGVAPAQVVAAIVPPVAPIVYEFGEATWVKEIRTTTHNGEPMLLRNLVADDPDNPNDKNWRNGEPDEVEVEWQILQFDSNAVNGGANGELVAAPENLPGGDEVVTRRWEFYEYGGPYDPETHEAMAQKVGPDGIHGVDIYTNDVIVGNFLGSQMSAVDVAEPVGLIDHLSDGEAGTPYTTRTVVIAGSTSFVATASDTLPVGMSFDTVTGELSGTPAASGLYLFTVTAAPLGGAVISKTYPLLITQANEVLPPHCAVDALAAPAGSGTAIGTGVYTNGDTITLTAIPHRGFGFLNWTDNGSPVTNSPTYTFPALVNRSLVANFVPSPWLSVLPAQSGNVDLAWPTNFTGYRLQLNAGLMTANWQDVTNRVTVTGTNNQVTLSTGTGNSFFRLISP